MTIRLIASFAIAFLISLLFGAWLLILSCQEQQIDVK